MLIWLVVKPAYLATAKRVFAGPEVNIPVEGRPYLGAMRHRVGQDC